MSNFPNISVGSFKPPSQATTFLEITAIPIFIIRCEDF